MQVCGGLREKKIIKKFNYEKLHHFHGVERLLSSIPGSIACKSGKNAANITVVMDGDLLCSKTSCNAVLVELGKSEGSEINSVMRS